MAPSQLKQLKASLRENGVLGPQKSKKQRTLTGKDAQKRAQRNAALEGIREQFNPFEVKAPARKAKYEFVNSKDLKAPVGRPGVTRGLGEERRRETLLKEMQSRNKVGGMLDRRFGEDDPTMTPEEKAAERFARQNERKLKKNSMFNLEDESEEEMPLTHGGRSLDFGGATKDDYDDKEVDDLGDAESDFDEHEDRPRKRLRLEGEAAGPSNEEEEEEMPQRKKTKNEVMKEVIAKSKFHKAERRAAKADDDDLRAALDKGMSDVYTALQGQKEPERPPAVATNPAADPLMDPSRAAMLAGKSRQDAEKDYEANLRQLKLEARSKPSVRTKSNEEKAAEEAARLEELERKRLRRMKGEAESSEDEEEDAEPGPDEDVDIDEEVDDAEVFGLSAPEAPPDPRRELEVEDEDEFVLDDDLIASGSDADMASEQEDNDTESEDESEDDGDDDFINGLVLPLEPKIASKTAHTTTSKNLAYTFPCPQTHGELLEVTKDTKATDLPTIVQRIRALYHKGLAEGNEEKLETFAGVLTQHLAHLADNDSDVPFSVLESLIRHLHSMAKSSPEAVGVAFREHLQIISEERPLQLSAGDLVILTGVATIFPTSDHFHSVVTPAMLTLARYLGQSSVQSHRDLGVGAYCCTLALRYQQLAKRYVPEVVTYITNALAILSPKPVPEEDEKGKPLTTPIRLPSSSLRIKSTSAKILEKLSFKALVMKGSKETDSAHGLALLHTFVRVAAQGAHLWIPKTALPELIDPFITTITHLSLQATLPSATLTLLTTILSTLRTLHATALQTRHPLLLHTHRPLAIKTSLPSFIDNYNPTRHYDPDHQRADLAKLKAQHKKERKGAVRELRKDASFVAREQLREKKERDGAYEKKFKRLVAEIQGEEGREGKGYEREKKRRTAKGKN